MHVHGSFLGSSIVSRKNFFFGPSLIIILGGQVKVTNSKKSISIHEKN